MAPRRRRAHKESIEFAVFDDCRLQYSQSRLDGRTVKFSLNLMTWVDGVLIHVVRYDNGHGQAPHVHRFYLGRGDAEPLEIHNLDEAFAWAKQDVVRHGSRYVAQAKALHLR